MSFSAFRFFGKPSLPKPSFYEDVQTLYRDNNYRGILLFGQRLIKGTMQYSSEIDLTNEKLFPILSHMVRKLSENPNYLRDSISMSSGVIGLAVREGRHASSLEEARFLISVREGERSFLLKAAGKIRPLNQKFEIYNFLADETLKGTFPSRDSISEWKILCNKILPLSTKGNFSRIVTLFSSLAAKVQLGDFEDDSRIPRFDAFLKDSFKAIVKVVKDDRELAAILAVGAFCGCIPPKWSDVVQDTLVRVFQDMSSQEMHKFWLDQSCRMEKYTTNSASVASLIKRVRMEVAGSDIKISPDERKGTPWSSFACLHAHALANFCLSYREGKRREPTPVLSPGKLTLVPKKKVGGFHL